MEQRFGDNIDRRTFMALAGAASANLLIPAETVFAEDEKPKPKEILLPPTRPLLHTLSLGSRIIVFDEQVKANLVAKSVRDLNILVKSPDTFAAFDGVRGLNQEQVMRSLEIYFPIYRIAQYISDVDWAHIAMTHLFETTLSLEPDPGKNGFVGAGQRKRSIHPDQQVEEIARAFGFLNTPDQRYKSPVWTDESTDYKELLWVGWHIDDRAEKFYPEMPRREAVRKVIAENYSANGVPRLWRSDLLMNIVG